MHDDPADLALFGPTQLPIWLLVLGIALLVLPLLWYLGLWWFTRLRPAPATLSADTAPSPSRRHEYLARIDEIHERLERRELTVRKAHLELAETLRALAQAVSPADPRTMSLSQIRRAGLTPLAETIETYYPAEFAPAHAADVEESFERARKLVILWS